MAHNKRDFNEWLSQFKSTIASYDYYVDFDKVVANAEKHKAELYLMNSLLGSQAIESDFIALVEEYPKVLTIIPTLIAVRATEVPVYEAGALRYFSFKKNNDMRVQDYADFMRSTGLFGLMENHVITNLQDYVTGIEVGLDSNGRKNRGGHLMENLVESYLTVAGLVRGDIDGGMELDDVQVRKGIYYKELKASVMQRRWGIDLGEITNGGTVEKRFDFVVRNARGIFGIETNFYSSGGSKLNETARSYKEMAQESEQIDGFQFVWVTDGGGWKSARNNLRETFEIMDTIYNLAELEDGAFERLFS